MIAEIGAGSGRIGHVAGQVIALEVDDDFAEQVRCPRHVDHHLGGNRLGACIFGVGRSSETAETALDLAQTAAAIAIKIVAIIARKHKAQTISAVLDAGKGHPVVAEFGATLQADCL